MITSIYDQGTGTVVVSLHGLNGHYDSGSTMVSDFKGGLNIPYRVIAAQLAPGDTDWGKDDLFYVANYIKSLGISDIHITGVSLGGMAVLRWIHFNDSIEGWPKLNILSAGVVCGKDDKYNYIAYSKIKIKCWHGTEDTTCTYSNIVNMVNKVKAIGGDIELKSLEGVGHNAWTYAYDINMEDNYFDWVTEIAYPKVDIIETVIKTEIINGTEIVYTTDKGNIYKKQL